MPFSWRVMDYWLRAQDSSSGDQQSVGSRVVTPVMQDTHGASSFGWDVKPLVQCIV